MIFYLYNAIIALFLPIYLCLILFRLYLGKEILSRIGERFAFTNKIREEGFLIWVHAASVGESIAALTLINKINDLNPNCNFLVTSGTKSSAQIIADKLPKNAIHQFLPCDHSLFVNKFLLHWKPNLCLFVESELWPSILNGAAKICPILLLNARISDRSFNIWKKFPFVFRSITNKFEHIFTQSNSDLKKFEALGVKTNNLGNIKFSNQKLKFDYNESSKIHHILGNKKIIVAASTHYNDEKVLFPLVRRLKQLFNCYFIIIPRHPERKNEILQSANLLGLICSVRSESAYPKINDDLYIVDKFGEVGLFYNIADIIFIGGSFSAKTGGHNPIEAAHFGKIILFGPNMNNIVAIAREMVESKSAIQVSNENELFEQLNYFLCLDNGSVVSDYKFASLEYVNKHTQVMELYLKNIAKYLNF